MKTLLELLMAPHEFDANKHNLHPRPEEFAHEVINDMTNVEFVEALEAALSERFGAPPKLRWCQQLNRVEVADVMAARQRGVGFSMMAIKSMLQDRTEMKLQYFDDATNVWVDVPTVVEYRETPTRVDL